MGKKGHTKERKIKMSHVDLRRAVSLWVLAAGLGTSAFAQSQPFEFFHEELAPNKGDVHWYYQYDLDFTKTSANPALNYPTFPNPKAPGSIVKFQTHSFMPGIGTGSCVEIESFGPLASDLVLSVTNQAGTWKALADDNVAGTHHFKARLFLKFAVSYTVRIHEYSSNPNNQNTISVKKINLNPGSAINATSCRVAGLPFWQSDLNLGNPYNPQ